MALFDPEAWDGELSSLPAELREKLTAKTVTTPEDTAAADAAFEDRIERALNRRTIDSALSGIKSRVSEERFTAAEKQFRQAVSLGGLSIDQASATFFPAEKGSSDFTPGRDPAGGAGTPTGGGGGSEWTAEAIAEQKNKLRRMSFSVAQKWRKDNPKYTSAEMQGYASSV